MIGPVPSKRPADLMSRWRRLLPDADTLGADLLARYAEPGRHYHDVEHLRRVLAALDLLDVEGEAHRPRLVALAAWFHDAVYDVLAPDNEARSAALAEQRLPAAGLTARSVAEVSRLVRLTATHQPEPGDADGAVLCDADLAILAAGPEEYAAYTAAVRREYAHVGDREFRAGRAAVLEQLLSLPSLFGTTYGRLRWETGARANVAEELSSLRS